MRKSTITIPYQNKIFPHSQANISQKPAEDQISRVLSDQAIRRTTRSMIATLFAKRKMSIGDVPVIEVSDSSEPRPNPAPIGPTFLDLKYVSVSGNNVVDIQQVNHECDQEIDQKPYIVEEDKGRSNGGLKEKINQNPYAQVISSLETDLKEAQVIKTFAMDEITGLKTDLISWIEKWNLLREKKLKYKDQVKIPLLRNRRLKKQNNIANIRAVRFKAKLDEARRSVPIRLSVE